MSTSIDIRSTSGSGSGSTMVGRAASAPAMATSADPALALATAFALAAAELRRQTAPVSRSWLPQVNREQRGAGGDRDGGRGSNREENPFTVLMREMEEHAAAVVKGEEGKERDETMKVDGDREEEEEGEKP